MVFCGNTSRFQSTQQWCLFTPLALCCISEWVKNFTFLTDWQTWPTHIVPHPGIWPMCFGSWFFHPAGSARQHYPQFPVRCYLLTCTSTLCMLWMESLWYGLLGTSSITSSTWPCCNGLIQWMLVALIALLEMGNPRAKTYNQAQISGDVCTYSIRPKTHQNKGMWKRDLWMQSSSTSFYVLFHFNLCIKVITNQEKLHSCCVNKEQCKDSFINKSCKFTSFS